LSVMFSSPFPFAYSSATSFVFFTNTVTQTVIAKFDHYLSQVAIPVTVRSETAWLLGMRFRIPLRAWIFISCVCCLLCGYAASATG
jgi:hypothetical protein